jgi:hypothetical protein
MWTFSKDIPSRGLCSASVMPPRQDGTGTFEEQPGNYEAGDK